MAEKSGKRGSPPQVNLPIPEQNVAPVTGARSCLRLHPVPSTVRIGRKDCWATLFKRFDMSKINAPKGKRVLWRAWITVEGRRIYASERGLRAFPIFVDE